MNWKEIATPVLTRLPIIKGPDQHVSFKNKAKWSIAILVLYFYLTNVPLYGAAPGQDAFGGFRSILAGSQGSIMQLGIGPIVTASIVLQLLSGADLLGLDTSDPRDQELYQGLQKLLVIIMSALTAFPLVYAGGFLPADTSLAASLGISTFMLQLLIFLQVFLGGILILYFDEVISKWGLGSGVGLFIIAGVSQRLLGGIFSWAGLGGEQGLLVSWFQIITGQTETGSLIGGGGLEMLIFGQGELLAIFTTIFIFAIVVYAESVRVEIPLSNTRVSGARGRFPIKLIYASVLPMILVRALQANVQFIGQIMNAQMTNMPSWLGVYTSDGNPTAGLFYYLAPIRAPEDWMWWVASTTNEPWQILTRVSVDLSIMVFGGAIFAIFWVETTNMGAEASAKKIERSGMTIPGFRDNAKVIEKVLARYIPTVTVVGGALVGALAVGANMLGTIGSVSGTGLLLTVSITYKLYEEIAEEAMMEMHPRMREFFQG